MAQRRARSMATFDTANPSSPTYYSASQTVLLLADFHSMFVNYAGAIAKPAAEKAVELRTWAKSQGIPVAHGLVDPNLPYAPYSKDPERAQGLINGLKSNPEGLAEPDGIRCDDGSEAMFGRAPGYVSVQKSAGFDDWLAKHGYKSLILAGISTSGCVLRTAIAATEADFIVTVVADACADSGEGVHDVMTKEVLPMRAHVANFEELKTQWAAAQAEKEKKKT